MRLLPYENSDLCLPCLLNRFLNHFNSRLNLQYLLRWRFRVKKFWTYQINLKQLVHEWYVKIMAVFQRDAIRLSIR